nr:hypothetical protein [Candidatus Gracilibacteria bacterium]
MKTIAELNNYRIKILLLLKNNDELIAKNIIFGIANDEFMQNGDYKGMYNFFSPIYDELFYELVTEKLKLSRETRNLLETLSLPYFKMDKSKKDKLLKRLK